VAVAAVPVAGTPSIVMYSAFSPHEPIPKLEYEVMSVVRVVPPTIIIYGPEPLLPPSTPICQSSEADVTT